MCKRTPHVEAYLSIHLYVSPPMSVNHWTDFSNSLNVVRKFRMSAHLWPEEGKQAVSKINRWGIFVLHYRVHRFQYCCFYDRRIWYGERLHVHSMTLRCAERYGRRWLCSYLGYGRQGSLGARPQQEVAEARDVHVPQATHHKAADAAVPVGPGLGGRLLLQQGKNLLQ
jgi:hypothetical protein